MKAVTVVMGVLLTAQLGFSGFFHWNFNSCCDCHDPCEGCNEQQDKRLAEPWFLTGPQVPYKTFGFKALSRVEAASANEELYGGIGLSQKYFLASGYSAELNLEFLTVIRDYYTDDYWYDYYEPVQPFIGHFEIGAIFRRQLLPYTRLVNPIIGVGMQAGVRAWDTLEGYGITGHVHEVDIDAAPFLGGAVIIGAEVLQKSWIGLSAEAHLGATLFSENTVRADPNNRFSSTPYFKTAFTLQFSHK